MGQLRPVRVDTTPFPAINDHKFAQEGDNPIWYPYQAFPQEPWTPGLTGSVSNPNLGTGSTLNGGLCRFGRFYWAWFEIVIGTGSTAGSGFYKITLPSEMAMDSAVDNNFGFGQAELNDSGSGFGGLIRTHTAQELICRLSTNDQAWSSTNHPIGDGDALRGSFFTLGT